MSQGAHVSSSSATLRSIRNSRCLAPPTENTLIQPSCGHTNCSSTCDNRSWWLNRLPEDPANGPRRTSCSMRWRRYCGSDQRLPASTILVSSKLRGHRVVALESPATSKEAVAVTQGKTTGAESVHWDLSDLY